MEKILEILREYQNQEWFYDIRVVENPYNDFVTYDEYTIELIVKDKFTIKNLNDIVKELQGNQFNVASFFSYEERGIKETYAVWFEVWRR